MGAMHPDKIRTANLPAFRLEPKDAVILMCLIGVSAYVFGLLVGLAF